MWTWIKYWFWGVEPTHPERPAVKEAGKPAPPIWLFIVPESGPQPRVTASATEAALPPAEPTQPVAVRSGVDHLFARRLASVQRLNPPRTHARLHRRPTVFSGKPRPLPVRQTLKRQPSDLSRRIARAQTAHKIATVVTLPIGRRRSDSSLDREAA